MTKVRAIGPVLALALGLAFPALQVRAEDGMTSPPWGDEGPKIVFGPEDKGLLQIDYKGQFRMTVRDTGSGLDDEDVTTNFGFRRNRLALRGAWGDVVSLYVQTEFAEDLNVTALDVASSSTGSDFQMLDAVVRFNFKPGFKLSVGKFKYNFSRENLEACEDPLTLDRSLFVRTAYTSTRDTGLAAWGNFFEDRLQYRLDAMEGRKAVSGASSPGSNPRFSARAHVTLLDPENGYGYKGTYLGKKKVLTFGGAVQFESKVAYTDASTRVEPEDYKGYTADGYFEYPFKAGTVTLSAAWEKVDLGEAYLGGDPDSGAVGLNGGKNGWYAKAGYLLPGTPLQLFGRYEKWRFARLDDTYDELVDWVGVGAHYYVWGQNLKISAEYSHTAFDKQEERDFNTFVTQLQFIF